MEGGAKILDPDRIVDLEMGHELDDQVRLVELVKIGETAEIRRSLVTN